MRKKRKSGFELAIEDVKEGRVTEYASVKDLIDTAKMNDCELILLFL